MKRKVLIGLGIITGIFFLGSVYIIFTIESATSRLDRMLTLHQVEILREHYLIQIKRVQADLLLKDTRHSKTFDMFVKDILSMGTVVGACYDCHHVKNVADRIDSLNRQTDEYQNALSRVLTIRANTERLRREEDAAFRIGEKLISEVRDMIDITSANLEEKRTIALSEITKTKYILYLLIGIIPLLSGALAYVFVREMTSPIHTLLASTRKLKGGELDHRVEGLKHEFGELAASFNDMAASLKEQMLKMQRTEQMVVVAELAAGLAHEIKNPLAGIKVAMHVLSEETDLADEDKAVLGKVIEEVGRLESLMKSFLNFAKPPRPRPASLDVNDLLDSTLAFYLKSHAAGPGGGDGIRIEKDFRPLPAAMADPMQLQQVFLNIILNAVDAMPGGGTLRIRTTQGDDPSFLRIEISDTGKGLPEEEEGKIFQPFFTTKPKGTGLGLAISRQMIERHGGSISAANNPDGGAVFRIHLPVSQPGGGFSP